MGKWLEQYKTWVMDQLTASLFTIGHTDVTLLRVMGLVAILLFVWWLAKGVEAAIQKIPYKHDSSSMSQSGIYALSRILRYIIWFFGTIMGLKFIGFDLGSLLLMGGAIGVGIGFGLQNIFSNLVSGIIILLEKTLKVGDFVDLESGVAGTVSEINMRYTRITTNDDVDIIVPNSEFINGRVVNWTYGNQLRRMHVPFGVAYGSDKNKVRHAALKAANSVGFSVEDKHHHTEVWLVEFADSSLNFELVVWIDDKGVRMPNRVKSIYLWEIETALKEAGVEIPFPQRDLHMRSGELQVKIMDSSSGE